jgi:hypothetical protein
LVKSVTTIFGINCTVGEINEPPSPVLKWILFNDIHAIMAKQHSMYKVCARQLPRLLITIEIE